MKEFKVGQKVRFINWEMHEWEPEYYPPVGTVGEIKEDGDDGTILVQWPKGTTSDDDAWWCAAEDVEVVEE